jgi:hypothetical protein
MTAAMLQFPVGIWVALAMPEAAREPLLGGDAVAALLFLGSLVLAMVQLHLLSALVLTQPTAQQAFRASAVLLLLVLLMVGTRLRLATHLAPAAPAAQAQRAVAGLCEAGASAHNLRGRRPQLQIPAAVAALAS